MHVEENVSIYKIERKYGTSVSSINIFVNYIKFTEKRKLC